MSDFLPWIWPGKWTAARLRSTHAIDQEAGTQRMARTSRPRDNAPKVSAGNLLPWFSKPASMRRDQKGPDEQARPK
jgi:hypothetical protein